MILMVLEINLFRNTNVKDIMMLTQPYIYMLVAIGWFNGGYNNWQTDNLKLAATHLYIKVSLSTMTLKGTKKMKSLYIGCLSRQGCPFIKMTLSI